MTDEVFDLLVRAHSLIWLATFKARTGAVGLAAACEAMHESLASMVSLWQVDVDALRPAENAANAVPGKAAAWGATGYHPIAYAARARDGKLDGLTGGR